MEVIPDHAHLLVECDLQFGIAKLIRYIKGRSSRILRAEYPLSVIKQYIENQKHA